MRGGFSHENQKARRGDLGSRSRGNRSPVQRRSSACIGGRNALCDALCELFGAYSDDHYGWAKEIWDISAVTWVANPQWAPTELVHTPWLSTDDRYSFDNNRPLMRVVRWLDRTQIFRDMYKRLSMAEEIVKKR